MFNIKCGFGHAPKYPPKTGTKLVHLHQVCCVIVFLGGNCKFLFPFLADSILGFCVFNFWVMLINGGACASLLSFVCLECKICARHKPLLS